MTQHALQGRTDSETLWFRRRSFMAAAATRSALGGFSAAQAQQRSNIVELSGDALLNGRRLERQQTIQTGDSLKTGPGSSLVCRRGQRAGAVAIGSRPGPSTTPTRSWKTWRNWSASARLGRSPGARV